MSRISWNEYFLAQAVIASLRATCTRLKVGAVIVRENRIIASGYNGSVYDSTHCIDEGCKMVDGHCVRTVHAEANALLQCAKFGIQAKDTTLYVTHFPCLQCTKLIIQSGITHIYYAHDYRNDSIAIELLKEANIAVHQVALDSVYIDEHFEERNAFINDLFHHVKQANPSESLIEKLEQKMELLDIRR